MYVEDEFCGSFKGRKEQQNSCAYFSFKCKALSKFSHIFNGRPHINQQLRSRPNEPVFRCFCDFRSFPDTHRYTNHRGKNILLSDGEKCTKKRHHPSQPMDCKKECQLNIMKYCRI